VENIESQYTIPGNSEFNERKFDKIKWSNSKNRNFFTIIKTLAELGSSTIDEIIQHENNLLYFKNDSSAYAAYRRVILGDKDGDVKGLIEKQMIVPSETDDKLYKKYELSLHGVFYAIKLFMDGEILSLGDQKGMLKIDPRVGGYDFSKQKEYPDTIVDILAKNYSHLIPLIFGKWNYLKKNPRIDVYRLFSLAIVKNNNSILLRNGSISSNTKYGHDFAGYKGDISLIFYSNQISDANYPIEYFLKAINDGEIKDFIEKIMYSYERLHRHEYHISQSQYFLYKGKKDKALKSFIKAIDCNDALDDEKKKYWKKTTVIELDNMGISF